MTIRFLCTNGHKLKADSRHGGQPGVCPKCSQRVIVPQIHNRVTDTSIMRTLGDFVAAPRYERSGPHGPGYRTCPRCHARVFATVRVCAHCNSYLPVVD